jgi:hypothetical protein
MWDCNRFFRHTNMLSFRRQLHIYEFIRIKDAIDQYAYYNPNFLRNQPERISQIKRAATIVQAIRNNHLTSMKLPLRQM